MHPSLMDHVQLVGKFHLFLCIMATCHGAGACDTGANATYDTACLQLATGDEQGVRRINKDGTRSNELV